ncbi:glycosyltransferase family 4 protein [Mesorhizobium sp. CGMCC 1.15528]|uniref:Glycosyltransferase family 4 protein n=1 Tax=Mesorhizobium zhangyense TaxID=1776730 RepID=A0A7C9VBL8_9HYPH|nr:glycosyltransferase family 4 protein [Mesorhizobium zhangyense]NGN41647.1 glycosyltransferase family 4 protein [Mesorhizobium zhangyense]
MRGAVCYLLSGYKSHKRAGLDYRRALEGAGVEITDSPAEADIVVLHNEPWSYPGYFRAYPELKQRHVIAYAVWEPDRLSPNVTRWLGLVDEIWTSSSYCRDIMLASGKPVTIVPHIVTPPSPDLAEQGTLRARFGLTDTTFAFYTIARLEERKNIEAGIRAFAKAFPDGGPVFIVKTPEQLPLSMRAKGVIAWGGDATDDEIAALHGIGQCCVSSHCAEGWGLCISDAMAHGNIVAATGFSGNMDYMTPQNSMPVAFSVEPICKADTRMSFGFESSNAAAAWAYVDEDDLSAKLRTVHDEWTGLAGMRTAAQTAMASYGIDAVAPTMLSRIDALHPRPRLSSQAGPHRLRPKLTHLIKA